MVFTNYEIVMRKPAPLEAIINGFEVIEDLGFYKNNTRSAIFKCKICSKNFESHVNRAKTRPSCGCLGSHKRKEINGYINGFKILKDLGYDHETKFKSVIAECKVCFKEYKVAVHGLNKRKSCGCVIKGMKVSKYTHSHRELLFILRNMKSRCYKEKDINYYNYGARGINICDDWRKDQDSFVKWSLENGWEKGLSIDRIDNNKGYNPDNCRWVPLHQQARNKRNNVLTMELAREIRKLSSIMTQSQLSKKYNMCKTSIRNVIINKTWREDAS